ncbi:hypothetical protein GCM10011247_02340 [Pseudomonas plecoglossicida]|nr:hypothetical protein GCM10011247_02340 [Pseudomonas plecoglossicida]
MKNACLGQAREAGRCENSDDGGDPQVSRFHTVDERARLFLISAGLIVAILDGRRRFGVGGNGWLFGVQAWEGKIRDFMHLVVPRKCE